MVKIFISWHLLYLFAQFIPFTLVISSLKWGKGNWAKLGGLFHGFTSNLGDSHSIHQRAQSLESSTAANPVIIDLWKGLPLSAILHVPEKGHLVIKIVNPSFHFSLKLKCFGLQSCPASWLSPVLHCWQLPADDKETFIGTLLLVRHYNLQSIQREKCSINTESREECLRTAVFSLIVRRIQSGCVLVCHNPKGHRAAIWTIWKWRKS